MIFILGFVTGFVTIVFFVTLDNKISKRALDGYKKAIYNNFINN